MSNAQQFETSLVIYDRVSEEPLYIPQGYVKIRSIYRLVHGITAQSLGCDVGNKRQLLCL